MLLWGACMHPVLVHQPWGLCYCQHGNCKSPPSLQWMKGWETFAIAVLAMRERACGDLDSQARAVLLEDGNLCSLHPPRTFLCASPVTVPPFDFAV
jgi:hypothetical protein